MESAGNTSKLGPGTRIQFGQYTFDATSGELWSDSKRVKLPRQPAMLLSLLSSRAGQVVSRDEIRQALWGTDTYIDFEQGINWCVREIRKVLKDDATNPRFVETIAKLGYRFVAPCSVAKPVAARRTPGWTPLFRRKLVAGTILTLAVFGAVSAFRAAPAPPTIVILPLDNFSGEARGDLLAASRTDYLIASLGANPRRLRVIDRPTAAIFKSTGQCIIKIGQQLHADYVFVGSIDSSQTGPRFSGGVFRVADNTQVWAQADINPLNDTAMAEIPRAITAAVR